MRYFIPHIVKARFSSITEMGFSIFLQSNVTIKILVFTLKLKDRKTENYKTASGHHKVEYLPEARKHVVHSMVTKPQAVFTRSRAGPKTRTTGG